MLAALRYRRAQAVVVTVLSALVCTGLVLAPLYARALEQATARTLLQGAGPATAGLRLAATSATQPALAPTSDQLVGLVAPDLRRWYGAPVTSTAVGVRRMPLAGQPAGRLLSRDGMCDHVTFATGRCPTAAGEVAVSTDQATAYGQPVGTSILLGEYDGFVSLPDSAPRTTVRVVGTYRQVDSPYWFGDRLTGSAATKTGYDDLLTPLATLTGPVTAPDGGRGQWFQPQYGADLPLSTQALGVDEVLDLGPRVAALVAAPYGVERTGSQQAATVSASSGLPALSDQVRTGATQAAVTVPLLTAQLELILGCVLWLVLVAAANQRRGEVAIARLRGRGTRGAQRLLLAETLPQVAVGVPLGGLLGVGATTLARRTVLTGDPPFEVPAAAVAVLVIGVLGMLGLVVLSVRRVCREPVADLVRSVPPRRRTFRLGVLEAMLVAAAAAAFVALVTGSVSGPVGQVAPTLLALAVGVVAARLLALGLPAAGRLLLRRGRAAAGTALLTAGRRPTTRWLVPVITVALSIVVVGVDLLAVGQRNWAGRADAEVGASSVLTLGSRDLQAVAAAVHRLDPQARHATPVVLVGPSSDQGGDGVTTMGVVPEEFARLARFPGVPAGSLAWDRLTAPTVAPLVLTGTRATYHVSAPAFRPVPPVIRQAPTTLVLALRVVRADGVTDTVALGPVPAAGLDTDVSVAVDCGSGCRVTGIGLLTPRGAAPVAGTVMVTDLALDGRGVDLGGQGDWRPTDAGDTVVTGAFPGPASVALTYSDNGYDPAFLSHASLPGVVPALTTAAATATSSGVTVAGSQVDGTPLLLRSAGTLPFAPGGPRATAVVAVGNLLAQGWTGRGSATLAAYVDTDDPTVVAGLRDGLERAGVPVLRTTRAADVRASYGASAAAWSLQLALAVAALSLLVAAAAVVVLVTTSARSRTRDWAGLRLLGLSPRGVAALAQLETTPVVLACAVLGAAVGLWAAPAAVTLVPLFTTPPGTYPLDLAPAWGPSLLAAGVGLLVVVAVTALTVQRVARRAVPSRLREPG
ncbi:FtsX-like permease family protein [Lapillicoccus jejuensis]|uniref:FtsX-like permease family protein n=1 Tax=Lapillicoccus jejuensis TaxID=402171 RepID=A0A542E181_9MICO|nr:FtsX-like permease family protein [Lapillicoccus jejuensis]TQJ09096.1 FtsX-like permease family protein [Lapillicoccus jejuensis]